MGNCKDCKHWHTAAGHSNQTTCERVDVADYNERVSEDGFALYAEALDTSGLTYALKTGPMFGCIHFEPRAQGG